ncbi:hypothetical protein [Paracraurococcus lichenis]|uniref:Uncharacterized protein n=1 Tax=Paracraurococcus lichenis TaxID=3064888 RepID=A0ABT9DZ80_9PROT|nr:hypothetical protein [Paracraurococcus sp. LOR1-02]MDO9709216.1 hypothetical protein [Paracraurococcus sp. LOR1-02]
MSDDRSDAASETEEGFVLLEGWMFGALMYPAAVERIEQFPPANDDDPTG